MWQRLGAVRRTPQAPRTSQAPAPPRAALRASEKTCWCSPPTARAAQSWMHVEPTRGTRALDGNAWMEGKRAGVRPVPEPEDEVP